MKMSEQRTDLTNQNMHPETKTIKYRHPVSNSRPVPCQPCGQPVQTVHLVCQLLSFYVRYRRACVASQHRPWVCAGFELERNTYEISLLLLLLLHKKKVPRILLKIISIYLKMGLVFHEILHP